MRKNTTFFKVHHAANVAVKARRGLKVGILRDSHYLFLTPYKIFK
jgi:hypothetical protein